MTDYTPAGHKPPANDDGTDTDGIARRPGPDLVECPDCGRLFNTFVTRHCPECGGDA